VVPLQIRRRIFVIVTVCLVCCGSLLVYLFYLQFVNGKRYAVAAFQQRAEVVPLQVPRGAILDSYGQPLTDTGRQLRLIAFPAFIHNKGQTAAAISRITGWAQADVSQQLSNGHQPVKFKLALTAAQSAQLTKLGIPGVVVAPEIQRYTQNSLAHHVLG